MNVALASRPRVPMEYIGRARLLREAVASEDQSSGEMMQSFVDRVMARYHRSKIPRVDTLVGIARAWQHDVPARGRLAIETALDKRKKTLVVHELRLTASIYQPQHWGVAERGLIVDGITLEVRPFMCRLDISTLVHLGLHALGRRLQRGVDASEAAVLGDIRVLAQAHHTIADRGEGADFSVPVLGGSWRGSVERVLDRRIGYDMALAVRTFIDGV